MATHSSILAWKIPWTEETGVHGAAKSLTQLSSISFRKPSEGVVPSSVCTQLNCPP